MDRKATAKETLRIIAEGYYRYEDQVIDIAAGQKESVDNSILITPEQGEELLRKYEKENGRHQVTACLETPPADDGTQKDSSVVRTANLSTVDGLLQMSSEGKDHIGILNFASARNPGGGFLNGAMAQEESIAASSGLYQTLTAHEEYYISNRACASMMYTNYGIYSPNVVFFRDGRFHLLEQPVTASVLTLPAVNMGQVRLKGENVEKAEAVMRQRMKLALAVFASRGDRNLILGAYGCGVFRNDPEKIAAWWRELLEHDFPECFHEILFAVLDRSRDLRCYKAFENI